MARNYGVTASLATQREVARLVRELGINEVAERLGIGTATVGRVASGAAVMRCTLEVVERKLSAPVESGVPIV